MTGKYDSKQVASANPLLATIPGSADYSPGDRISIAIATVEPGLPVHTYATVDLYARHDMIP